MGRKLTGEKPKPGTIRQRRYRARLKRQAKNPNRNADEWGTPARYIARVLEVLGRIDCDPASNAFAQTIIKAAVFYTAAVDGLIQKWLGTVFLNPPYSRKLIERFVAKLLAELRTGRCTAAIVLVNASTSAEWYQLLLGSADAVCQVNHRIEFIDADGKCPGDPSNSQTFFYFGDDPQRFAAVFKHEGEVHLTGNRLVPPLAAAAD
jgi:phage N-6-adenine-methyltransferase